MKINFIQLLAAILIASFTIAIGLSFFPPVTYGAAGSYSNPLPIEQYNGYEVRVLETRWGETPIKMKVAGNFGQVWVEIPKGIRQVYQWGNFSFEGKSYGYWESIAVVNEGYQIIEGILWYQRIEEVKLLPLTKSTSYHGMIKLESTTLNFIPPHVP